MFDYLVRRLLLLPITLFAIILVNFIILNLVPGDPVNSIDRSSTGEATRSAELSMGAEENHHLLFREHYGLTKPILFNTRFAITQKKLDVGIQTLLTKSNASGELYVEDYHSLKTVWGDRAFYIMPMLLQLAMDERRPLNERKIAGNLFIRGGTRMGFTGPTLSAEQKKNNRLIGASNQALMRHRLLDFDNQEQVSVKVKHLAKLFEEQGGIEHFSFKGWKRISVFFFDTRFINYFAKVLTLDFGTLRNDNNKTVLGEVSKKIKYSLTLAVLPMIITFVLCQYFGMVMAIYHNRPIDYILNVIFLILFAIPIFVVAPFLIEKIAMSCTIPFTKIPIPYSGFQSPDAIYQKLTSWERLGDIALHLILPLVAVMYGMLAVQARLSRTAFLEVLNQNHVKAAHAKGLPLSTILWRHVGKNGAITIVTSLATSLGVILGGSLIVETVFEINGFGRFFYEAILNRDYNVVLFSAFAGSMLSLVGYLLADITYTILDPRVSLK